MRKIILTTVFIVAAFFTYLAFYLGYFLPVEITEEDAGPFRVLSKNHLGPYHKIVPTIEEVETWGKAHGLSCKLTFGVYEDDPSKVEDVRLRSRGGCVLSENEAPDDDLPEGFKIEELPAGFFVKAVFEGSPGIGPFKVYPMLQQRMEEKKYKMQGWGVIEIYEVKGPKEMTTTYYAPAEKQAE